MTEQLGVLTGFAAVNGAQLYYEEAGEGHPLLLIHGGLGDSRMWDGQFTVFAEHFRTIRFDLRGFGRSSMPPGNFASHEDVVALLDDLQVSQAHVVGVSLGGRIAVDFTLAHPERVTSLVLVASALGGHGFSDNTMRLIDEADEVLESGDIARGVELENRLWIDGPARSPDMVDASVRARVAEMNSAQYRRPPVDAHPTALTPPAAQCLHKIRVPTFIVTGDRDVEDILEIARVLKRGVPGAQTAVIGNAAHHPQMERPAEFNRHVLNFLTRRLSL